METMSGVQSPSMEYLNSPRQSLRDVTKNNLGPILGNADAIFEYHSLAPMAHETAGAPGATKNNQSINQSSITVLKSKKTLSRRKIIAINKQTLTTFEKYKITQKTRFNTIHFFAY